MKVVDARGHEAVHARASSTLLTKVNQGVRRVGEIEQRPQVGPDFPQSSMSRYGKKGRTYGRSQGRHRSRGCRDGAIEAVNDLRGELAHAIRYAGPHPGERPAQGRNWRLDQVTLGECAVHAVEILIAEDSRRADLLGGDKEERSED